MFTGKSNDASPIFVFGGELSMVLAMGWLTFAAWQLEINP
jgi:hypothetical protein